MELSNQCPECGQSIPADDPLGLCLRCLVIQGLDLTAASLPDIEGPREVGGYLLMEEIARGAMGVLYRARQTKLNRLVALKMILYGNFAGPDYAQRLRDEASAAAGLRHRNIVAIHDVGEHQGQPFIAMELVEGSDLARLTQERPLPPRQAARYMESVARAIHLAHQQRILHRDLKPSNILIDLDDEPKVTDFGLAKKLDVDSRLSLSGHPIGTPAYMPPEQVGAKSTTVGPWSDIYSLGAVLYHLLTGRPPFLADTLPEQFRQILQEKPAAPRAINPSVPADLQTICLKCLEHNPVDRYSSAEALAEDLHRWSNNEPILARPAPFHQQAVKWMQRHPAIVLMVCLAMVACVLGVALLFEKAQARYRTARTELAQSETLTTKNLLRFVTAETAGRQGDSLRQLATLNGLVYQSNTNSSAGHTSRVASVAMNRLVHLISSRGRLIPAQEPFLHLGEISRLEISPDGNLVAYAQTDGQVGVWNSSAGRTLLVTNVGQLAVASMAFDAQSLELRILLQSGGGEQEWEQLVSTNGIRLVKGPRSSHIMRASEDGKTLLTGHESGDCVLWEARTKTELRRFKGLTNEVIGLDYDQRRSQVVALSKNGNLHCWSEDGTLVAAHRLEVSPKGPTRIFPPLEMVCAVVGTQLKLFDYSKEHSEVPIASIDLRDPILDLDWSADGRFIAVACSHRASTAMDSRVWLVDVARRSARPDPLVQNGVIHQVRFSPNGTVLATASDDGLIHVWDPENGETLAVPAAHPESVTALCFSADSKRLAAGSNDKSVVLWRLEPAINFPVRGVSPTAVCDLDVARAADLYATASWDGELKIWKWGAGAPFGPEFKHPAGLLLCRLTPSGRQVVTFAADKKLRLWSVGEGSLLQESQLQTSVCNGLEMARDGSSLALSLIGSNWTCSVSVWRLKGEMKRSVDLPHPWLVSQISFSPDGKLIATACWDGLVRLWRASDGTKIAELIGRDARNSPVSTAMMRDVWSRIFQDGDFRTNVLAPREWPVAIGSNTLRGVPVDSIVDPRISRASGSRAALGDMPFPFKAFGFQEQQSSAVLKASYSTVAFSPDGSSIGAGTSVGAVHIWKIPAQGKPEQQPWRTFHHEVGGGVNSVDYSPNGRFLISAGADLTARIWDIEAAQEACAPLQHGSEVHSACFHPGGGEVLTFDSRQVVRTWDVGTGLPLEGPFRAAYASSLTMPLRARTFFSPDGRYALAGSSEAQAWEWGVWRPTFPAPAWFVHFVSALSGRDVTSPAESSVPPLGLLDHYRQRTVRAATNSYGTWVSELFGLESNSGRDPLLAARRSAYVRELIALDSPDALTVALRLDPTNAAVLGRLAQRVSEADLSPIGIHRAAHLRGLAKAMHP